MGLPRNCEHGNQYYSCLKCPGPGVCEHKRRRSRCKECKGSEICKHNRVINSCRVCEGSRFCIHDRQRHVCKVCGGFEVLAKNLLYGATKRAKEANIPINITREDILELIG